ncbi:glycosyltransferase [Brevibacillus migulae]|uniref:glycosyltransferase n=1 Tax=Brevibacillus migulae TaxID=1644114 RepID=UPI00106E8909|nr:glycosyltransferase [Brevibacillus migulae]
MNDTFRIFHCPINIAGQMGYMVKGLRALGHTAIGFNTYQTYLNYTDSVVNADWTTVVTKFEEIKHDYDIFHYHFGSSLFEDLRDVKELSGKGKKFVMHHWGNDVRIKEKASILSQYLLDPCNPLPDHMMMERLKRNSEWIHTVIIQDFEMYPYVKDYYPNIHVLPLLFDVAGTVPFYPQADKQKPLIIHAPTQSSFKGTASVEETLSKLQQDGFAFDYKRIEKISNEEALAIYKKADLVIDQLLVGSYGLFAVEAMALGKPVVSYIREDLWHTFPPNLPIVSANPDTFYQVLAPLLTDAAKRYEIGVNSRVYAAERHDIQKVIPQLVDIYRGLLQS